LGLTLKVTPSVHDDAEVTLNIDTQYKVLAGGSLNGIPAISQRTLKSEARLEFGQWAVLAGALSPQEGRTLSGIAGLSRVPFLGSLLSMHTNTRDDSQVLILIRPLLITPPRPGTGPVFMGPLNRPVTPL
jgi:general secretion pathway protein D